MGFVELVNSSLTPETSLVIDHRQVYIYSKMPELIVQLFPEISNNNFSEIKVLEKSELTLIFDSIKGQLYFELGFDLDKNIVDGEILSKKISYHNIGLMGAYLKFQNFEHRYRVISQIFFRYTEVDLFGSLFTHIMVESFCNEILHRFAQMLYELHNPKTFLSHERHSVIEYASSKEFNLQHFKIIKQKLIQSGLTVSESGFTKLEVKFPRSHLLKEKVTFFVFPQASVISVFQFCPLPKKFNTIELNSVNLQMEQGIFFFDEEFNQFGIKIDFPLMPLEKMYKVSTDYFLNCILHCQRFLVRFI